MSVDDANTVALLHFDGIDGGTTFTDESGKAWTANGNAELDTAQKKFDTASALFDNDAASYIETPYHADFALGSSDWTTDFWVRLVDLTYHEFIEIGEHPNQISVQMYNGYLITFFASIPYGIVTSPGISINTWTHIAVVKTHATDKIQLFVDGVSKINAACAVNPTIAGVSQIGGGIHGFGVNGWMDEVRISNKVRWAANFTPPDEAYLGAAPEGFPGWNPNDAGSNISIDTATFLTATHA